MIVKTSHFADGLFAALLLTDTSCFANPHLCCIVGKLVSRNIFFLRISIFMMNEDIANLLTYLRNLKIGPILVT